MSVYVDSLVPCAPNRRWRWDRACHLFADGLDELHAFAAKIGLKRSWFQGQGRLKHYDLTPGKRQQAIGAGATEASRETVVAHIRRGGGPNLDLEEGRILRRIP